MTYAVAGTLTRRLDAALVALGLIAGGATKRAMRESRFNDVLIAGAALWVLILAGTRLGYF